MAAAAVDEAPAVEAIVANVEPTAIVLPVESEPLPATKETSVSEDSEATASSAQEVSDDTRMEMMVPSDDQATTDVAQQQDPQSDNVKRNVDSGGEELARDDGINEGGQASSVPLDAPPKGPEREEEIVVQQVATSVSADEVVRIDEAPARDLPSERNESDSVDLSAQQVQEDKQSAQDCEEKGREGESSSSPEAVAEKEVLEREKSSDDEDKSPRRSESESESEEEEANGNVRRKQRKTAQYSDDESSTSDSEDDEASKGSAKIEKSEEACDSRPDSPKDTVEITINNDGAFLEEEEEKRPSEKTESSTPSAAPTLPHKPAKVSLKRSL